MRSAATTGVLGFIITGLCHLQGCDYIVPASDEDKLKLFEKEKLKVEAGADLVWKYKRDWEKCQNDAQDFKAKLEAALAEAQEAQRQAEALYKQMQAERDEAVQARDKAVVRLTECETMLTETQASAQKWQEKAEVAQTFDVGLHGQMKGYQEDFRKEHVKETKCESELANCNAERANLRMQLDGQGATRASCEEAISKARKSLEDSRAHIDTAKMHLNGVAGLSESEGQQAVTPVQRSQQRFDSYPKDENGDLGAAPPLDPAMDLESNSAPVEDGVDAPPPDAEGGMEDAPPPDADDGGEVSQDAPPPDADGGGEADALPPDADGGGEVSQDAPPPDADGGGEADAPPPDADGGGEADAPPVAEGDDAQPGGDDAQPEGDDAQTEGDDAPPEEGGSFIEFRELVITKETQQLKLLTQSQQHLNDATAAMDHAVDILSSDSAIVPLPPLPVAESAPTYVAAATVTGSGDVKQNAPLVPEYAPVARRITPT